MSAHVAIIEDSEGGYMAVRFPSIEALDEWADSKGVFVINAVRMSTRAEAIKASR